MNEVDIRDGHGNQVAFIYDNTGRSTIHFASASISGTHNDVGRICGTDGNQFHHVKRSSPEKNTESDKEVPSRIAPHQLCLIMGRPGKNAVGFC